MNKIHLDTDLGGDIDDLCALAMLLRWPGVELTGITTFAEDTGRRAGHVGYVLGLEARAEIPTRKLRDQDNIEMNWRMHQQWNEDRLTPFSAKFER